MLAVSALLVNELWVIRNGSSQLVEGCSKESGNRCDGRREVLNRPEPPLLYYTLQSSISLINVSRPFFTDKLISSTGANKLFSILRGK